MSIWEINIEMDRLTFMYIMNNYGVVFYRLYSFLLLLFFLWKVLNSCNVKCISYHILSKFYLLQVVELARKYFPGKLSDSTGYVVPDVY